MTLLVVDTREIHGLVRQLEVFSSKALPYAIRDSLNRSALAAKNVWADEIRSSMILRNRWTLGSLRVVNATGMDPRRMVAVTGSIARYMGTQEEGGKKTKHGKHGVAIPTKTASGEGRGSGPRQRLVRGPMKLGSIQVQNRTGISRKQRNAVSIRRALSNGKRFVYLELATTQGLFRISGGKRNPRLDMVWETRRPAVMIPRNPTLERALVRLDPHLPAIHLGALREQAARHRLFGY